MRGGKGGRAEFADRQALNRAIPFDPDGKHLPYQPFRVTVLYVAAFGRATDAIDSNFSSHVLSGENLWNAEWTPYRRGER